MIPTFHLGQFGRNQFAGGQSAGAGHRYWRLNITANAQSGTGGNVALGEIQLRESVGGSDATGSGTATASTTVEGLASNAFDNNAATYWAANAGSGWLKYDFGAGVNKDIKELVIAARTGPFFYQAPRDFALEWSDDDSTWTSILSRTYEVGWADGESRSFDETAVPSGETRFWRVYVNGINSSEITIAELQFRTTSGGADVTGTGEAGAGIEGGGISGGASYLAPKAFDNNGSSFWYRYSYPVWVGYAWPSNSGKTIAEFAITARNDGFSNQAPKDFLLQSSTDMVSWTTVKTVTGQTSWTAGETRVFTV